jgi:hypothetical protein
MANTAGGDDVGLLGQALESVESGGNPNAVSPKGAIGLRQIMPTTAADYGVSKDQLYDPVTNRKVGNQILGDLLKRYNGDVDAALVAYNAGPGVADKWLAAGKNPKVLPAETQAYVPQVKDALAKMQQSRPVQLASADNSQPLPAGNIPAPPQGTPALTQQQQYAADIAAGKRPVFPPGQRFNSRGEAIASDLKPALPGAYFPAGTPTANPGMGAPPQATPGAPDMSAIPQAAPGTGLYGAAPGTGLYGGPTMASPASMGPQRVGGNAAAPPGQQPGVPPLIRIPGVPVPVPGAMPSDVDKRALALALLGTQAATAGLGDTVKPLEQYYYGSPGYKGQVAGAEKWAGVAPSLFEKWNTPESVRPGGGQMVGGQVIGSMPALQRVVDPATGREEFQYMSPTAGGPGAPGMVGSSLGVAKLGPYEIAAGKTRAEKEQADRQQVITEANAALQSRATLLNMQNETPEFYKGAGADKLQGLARYLRIIDPSWNGQVAGFEDFQKNAGALTRQAVKDVSSRAAVQEFNLIGASLPNPEMSPIGLRRVQNEMIGLTDYRLAKAQAQQQWEQAHGGPGNVTGFETYFQRAASPYAFIVAKMDPNDRREMFAKLQGSADGQRELSRLGRQLTYLKQSGLAQ